MRNYVRTYLVHGMMIMISVLLSSGLAWAGSLEPPPDSVDGSGDPVGTEHPLEEFIVGDRDVDPAARFSLVLGGAGVLDARTTLVWEQSPSTTERSQPDSVVYCANLNLGGQTDWRLPEAQELVSLVGYENFDPALPTGHPFSIVDENLTTESSRYWTATSGDHDPRWAWRVQFGFGLSVHRPKTHSYFAWCVR